MKNKKLLLGALSLTALTPALPLAVTSCNKNNQSTGFVVSFSARNGKFKNGTTNLILKNVEAGTRIKDILGYERPQYTKMIEGDDDCQLLCWYDGNGKLYREEDQVSGDIVLGAYYGAIAGVPTDYESDNWATIATACKSAKDFANAYLSATNDITEDEAISLINQNIRADSSSPLKKDKQIIIWFDDYTKIKVKARLIGVNIDKLASGQEPKTLFTFEFADIIGNYVWDQNNRNAWIDESLVESTSCSLRTYCNEHLIYNLPAEILLNMKQVAKKTWVPQKTSTEDQKYVQSSEWLFPISTEEYGVGSGTGKNTTFLGNATYPYYQYTNGTPINTHLTKNLFGIPSGINQAYWTRSPISTFDGSTKYDKVLRYLSECIERDNTNLYIGVAPAFCL